MTAKSNPRRHAKPPAAAKDLPAQDVPVPAVVSESKPKPEPAPESPPQPVAHGIWTAPAAPVAAPKVRVPLLQRLRSLFRRCRPAAPVSADGFRRAPKRKQSGLSDFLGAMRTIGLGAEKTALIDNLATMLNAGLPIVDSLKTLKADTRTRTGRQLVQRITDAVENGSPLWRAFADEHCFPPDVIALVRIGEEAGNLSENMVYLAVQQEKDQALRSKVKMAMIYPTIVLILMVIVIMGLGIFVLPSLVSVLFSLNVPLPLVTRGVIAFTGFFTTQGHIAVPGVLGGMILLVILGKFTPLKIVAQWVVFRIPGIGKLAREATIARFGVILGGLLRAGVPVLESLESLADVTSVESYKRFYRALLEHVKLGDSFGKSFTLIRGSGKLLPMSVQQLVTTGERSGALSTVLLKVADIYEKKANDTAQKLPVILEPMLLLFIGGLVGTIAFSIIVPIYSIVGNVGAQ